MSKFLCITNGTMALGETYVIFRFADQLRRAGHEVFFVSPPYAARFLDESGYSCSFFQDDRKANDEMLDSLIRNVQPDMILLADYYFFHISHHLRRAVDLLSLFKRDIPIGVFDNGDFYKTGKTGRFKNAFTHFTTTLPLPRLPQETAFLLKPAPPHNPGREEKKVFRYHIATEPPADSSPAERAQVRDQLDCPADAKLFLWPVPGYLYELRWSPRLHHVGFGSDGKSSVQFGMDNPKRRPESNWYTHVNRLLVDYLADLDGPVHVVNMCPYANEYGAEGKGAVTVKNIEPVGFERFDRILAATDLFCIDNRFSTTLGRALFFPTQTACIINSLAIVRGRTSVEPSFPLTPRAHEAVRTIERAHPRAVKPSYFSHIGWKHVLEGLVRENPFSDTYGLVDIFKDAGAVESLRGLLFDEAEKARRTTAKETYRAALTDLPGPVDICEQFLSGEST